MKQQTTKMSKAISIEHDVREWRKTHSNSWAFSSVPCFVKLSSAGVRSNLLAATYESEWEGGGGEEKKGLLVFMFMWPTEYQWALNYLKWMKENKKVNAGTDMSKESAREVFLQNVCIHFPWRKKKKKDEWKSQQTLSLQQQETFNDEPVLLSDKCLIK